MMKIPSKHAGVLVICILLMSSTNCLAQPKIIISKCRCSTIKKEKDLYDKIKGSQSLDTAFARIQKYFIEAKGDYFQLQCLTGCTPPLILEFPYKKARIVPKEKDDMGIAYHQPVRLLILDGHRPDTDIVPDYRPAMIFKNTLITELSRNKDSSINIIELSDKDMLNAELAIKSDSGRLSTLAEYIIFTNVIGEEELRLTILENKTNPVIKSYFPSRLINLSTGNSVRLEPPRYEEIDYYSAAKDILAYILPLQRDTLNTINIKLVSWGLRKRRIQHFLESALPVITVKYPCRKEWTVEAACQVDCLADIIRSSGLGKKYTVRTRGGNVIRLSYK